MPLDDMTRALLAVLHGGGVYSYWWTLEGQRSAWWPIDKPAPLPAGKRNIYFGLHPTTQIPPTNARGEKKPPAEVRSQLGYIAEINCFYSEFDAKDYDGDKGAALQAAETMEPPASAIVDSGGGYHVYHLLNTPWVLTDDETHDEVRRVQAAWVAYAGSDPAVKDLARVLRVPGTLNYKYNPPRPVCFVRCELDRRYDRDDLRSRCAHLIEAKRPPQAATPTREPTNNDQRYALSALDKEVAIILRAPANQKHETILSSALKLGTFVPLNLLTEEQIFTELCRAAGMHRDDIRDTERTVRDGIAYGKLKPRSIPEPKVRTDRQTDPPHPAVNGAMSPSASHHRPDVDRITGEIMPRLAQEYTEWRPPIISAADLYRKQFPNLVWLVDGILPEGLCLLAAKPKSKKSWLALGIAVGVAYGGKAFGYYDVMQGRVLYLDLESNQRRMKTRLRSIIGDRTAWPANFDIVTEWKRGDEGIVLLSGYCDAHPDTRLIVIDIWARFRAMRDPKADPYEQDYNALQALNAWAESRNVTVIVIHHTRKAKSDDVFEEISGTTGIVGAVATAMVLTRSSDTPDEQLLHMTGRDLIIDDPIALKWDHYTCQHVYVATGAEASSSAERRAILEVMEDDEEYHLKDLAARTKKTMSNLANLLRRLMDDNLVQRTGRGKYARVIIPNEVSEIDEVSEIGVISEQFSTKDFIDDSPSEIANEIGLTHQDAENEELHQFHRDSHGIVDRLRNRGAPRVLTGDTLQEAMQDSDDTTFSQFTGTSIEEDDHATEGEE